MVLNILLRIFIYVALETKFFDGKLTSEPSIVNALMKVFNASCIELGMQNSLKALKGMLDLIQASQAMNDNSRIDLD